MLALYVHLLTTRLGICTASVSKSVVMTGSVIQCYGTRLLRVLCFRVHELVKGTHRLLCYRMPSQHAADLTLHATSGHDRDRGDNVYVNGTLKQVRVRHAKPVLAGIHVHSGVLQCQPTWQVLPPASPLTFFKPATTLYPPARLYMFVTARC